MSHIRLLAACFLIITVAVNVVACGFRFALAPPDQFDTLNELLRAGMMTVFLYAAILMARGV